jgi:hypothetical protein
MELNKIHEPELKDLRLVPFNVDVVYDASGGTLHGRQVNVSIMSYVKYCQFIILIFITGLILAMGWWTVGVMPDNSVLPLLPHPVGPTKAGMSKIRKGSNVRRS